MDSQDHTVPAGTPLQNGIPLQPVSQPANPQHHASHPPSLGFLQHPIRSLSPEDLETEVKAFITQHGLVDLGALLREGAELARAPHAPQNTERLEPADLAALRDENERPYHHPAKLWYSLAACSAAAMLQGWSQVAFAPGNEAWFGLDEWRTGLVVSSPYFVAALGGCWLSEPLNERYGRRGPLLAAAVVNLFAALGAASGQQWWHVLICRGITGISMGLKASVAPILASEISPPSVRGSLVMGAWQICVAGGIWMGYTAALVANDRGKDAWRYQIASPFVLSLPLMPIYWYCVESPRWQIKKGRYREAYDTLTHIRNRPVQAARDLYSIAAQVRLERRLLLETGGNRSTYIMRFVQLFSRRRNRSATVAASTIMLGQQLCGINVIIFFGFSLFPDNANTASGRATSSLWIMWGIGFLNMIAGLPGLYFSDILGRRRLLLWLYPTNFVFMLATGLSYMIPESRASLGVIATFMFLFVASYSPAQGPVAFLYASEAFPVTHRELGMSFSVAINLFSAGALAILYPTMNSYFKKRLEGVYVPNYTLVTFAALNVLAMGMIYFLCRETKLYTLEELDRVFAVSIRHFAVRKLRHLRGVFRYYVLRQDDAVLDDDSDA